MRSRSQVRISKLKSHPRGFRFVAIFWEGDQRRKKYFKNKTGEGGADEFKGGKEAELASHGTTQTITSEERSAVVEHRDALAKAGLTLRGLITDALYAAERRCKSSSVMDIIESLLQQREREKKSQRHLDDLKSRLTKFSSTFGTRIAADINTQEIDDWLIALGVSERTVINYRRIISAMFNHGEKRGMCPENPATNAYRPTPPEMSPGILTPEQARDLLAVADPRIIPSFALGMFGGLRTSEIAALTWGDIDFTEETVRVRKSKSGARDVTMKPALLAWLQPYSIRPSNQLVQPTGWSGRELIRKAREAAGFGPVMKNPAAYKSVSDKNGKDLIPFPNNALRHSYGSYALVESHDAAAVAYQLGHKGDTRILFNHYRALVKPSAAKAYWAIRPRKDRGDRIIQMK
jgi:integrase